MVEEERSNDLEENILFVLTTGCIDRPSITSSSDGEKCIIAQVEHEYISWYKYCFEDVKLNTGIFFPESIHFIKQTPYL